MQAAQARPANKEAANEDVDMIQEMLKSTESKREERRLERLNSYYKRNFVVCPPPARNTCRWAGYLPSF